MQMTCPHCAKKLQIPARLLGRTGKCPGCQNRLEFPQATSKKILEEAPPPEATRTGEKILAASVALSLHAGFLVLLGLLSSGEATGIEGKAKGPSVQLGSMPDQQESLTTSKESSFEESSVQNSAPSNDDFSQKIEITASPFSNDDLASVDIPSAPGGASGGDGTGGLVFGAPGGGGARGELGGGATFMGTQAKGNRFCIIADNSGSMTGAPLEFVKAEILETLTKLRGSGRFYVIFFNSTAVPMPSPSWLKRKDVVRVVPWIKGIRAGGGTVPTPAFQVALTQLKPRPDVIFFMTDGAFGDRPAQIDALNKPVRGKKVVIHTISFLNKFGEGPLRQIALDSKGTYRHVPGFMRRP